jgi:hypothetical protein
MTPPDNSDDDEREPDVPDADEPDTDDEADWKGQG